MLDKRNLSERDICTKFITPAIANAGWNIHTQMREEFGFTKGKVVVGGRTTRRGESKRADYVLYYKPNIPIALIEAKDNKHSVGSGMPQALDYAAILDIPFVYSSNGDAFLEHDCTVREGVVERERRLEDFPSPEELWERYRAWKGMDEKEEEIVTHDYYSDGTGKVPRYYQLNAINRTIEAIVKGEDRILLVMATGTGKTYTAFQIIWRLWKARDKKRILFLADRNILVDQTRQNDFKPFGGAMTKVTNRKADTAYEIYLALYQAVSGSEEEDNIYKQFSRDFFDLVVVDECHRGSAEDDSAWRKILEYFSSATQIGLTATPKETEDVSNSDYFGEPIYTYSLKQGIEDGFLAPYNVIRIDIDKDLTGWQPSPGELDKYGRRITNKNYTREDFDRKIVLEHRNEVVAAKITEFLKNTDRFAKTIVFCENIEHAERMRHALVNQNADLAARNSRYVMQITGDNAIGKAELDNFIMPDSTYPVIVTTSKLMTTGVDAQTCKLIVLDRTIKSMSEFKQIIGRGTRINEAHDKFFFTIMDFKNATSLFADPKFDGDPVRIYVPKPDGPVVPPDTSGEENEPVSGGIITDFPMVSPDGSSSTVYSARFVTDTSVKVVGEGVTYFGKDGKPVSESLKDYAGRIIRQKFPSLDDFLAGWDAASRKEDVARQLEEEGILLEEITRNMGTEYDYFDLVRHVGFGLRPLTRSERAALVGKRNHGAGNDTLAAKVMAALLEKYGEGVADIQSMKLLSVTPINRIATPVEIITAFGGREEYLAAVRALEREIYSVG